MSYEIPIVTAPLPPIDGHPGLEVVVSLSVPFESFLLFSRLASGEMDDMDAGIQQFGDEIIQSWNITSKGVDVPATGEGFKKLPAVMLLGIMAAWLQAVREPGAPLGQGSISGPSSPEQPIDEQASA